MTRKDISPTVSFDADKVRRDNIRQVLLLVQDALEERGYNAINQLADTSVSLALSCNSLIVLAPQLHIVDLILATVKPTLSFNKPAYGT